MVKDELIERIQKRKARIGVVGLGYVGLPLVLRFGEEHFSILGFDVDPVKVSKLNAGESYIRHIPAARLQGLIKEKQFEATTDFNRLAEADCIIICVPTPLTAKKDPDLQYIEKTADAVLKTLRKGQLISLESTTYPGTTEELLLERFRGTGLVAGKDYFLVFSPEREDPGNPKFSTRTIPKVVGGITADCLEVGKTLYSQVIDRVIPVSSTRAAELVKLLENIYRGVNIALVNELKLLTQRMGIDVWEVIDAASTKPFGYTPFYPGPGLGGHCIPIDPFYLSWKAKEYDFSTRFIQLAGEINTSMPHYVVERIGMALNDRAKSIRDSKILILGVAYKKDVDDVRESPALEIMEILQERGANLSYSDPYIPRLHKMRAYDFSNMSSIQLTEDSLKAHDLALITTDHSSFDYQWIVDHALQVIDTRNATRAVKRGREKIVRA
ncbi:MAG TPA: nucleotide sugar dehydrogenase [Terriglobia bacterium]|nr:nucleotide sugar dehydrogenase [Terriglobia bacterium]